ncbi:MAG: PEGA domain-containing protein [Oligoflexus sp.]
MKRLFAGQTEVESIRKVQNCEIPYDLRELNSEVDNELYQIVMKGLAKDRKNRYQTAAAFEKDLLRYLHTRYSDFTSSELGNFLKRILAKRRDKTQDDIKETLSQLAGKPQVGQVNTPQEAEAPAPAAKQNEVADGEIIHEPSRISRAVDQAGFSRNFQPNARSISANPATGISPQHTRSHYSQQVRSLHRGTNVTGQAYPNALYRKQSTYRQNKKSSWPMILLGLFVIVGATFFFRHYLFDDKLHIKLDVQPDSVQITVNGTKIQDGYTKTPAKISLKPGNYNLEISRPGYEREALRINGKQGETVEVPKIFLKRLNFSNLVPVRIQSPNKRLFINVNNGLYRGSTPMQVELTPGVRHSISFYSGDQQKRALRCSFTAQRSQPDSAQTMTIRVLSDGRVRCSVRN